MLEAVRVRHTIAARVAGELHTETAVAEVWLEGPLTEDLAHSYSDVDLRVLTETDEPPAVASRLVDGIRVDLSSATRADMERLRALLAYFEVHNDDVELFRRVRRLMGALTRLRTALRRTTTGWEPILDAHERDVYRRWAVADQTERVLSLAEDLLGLLTVSMHDAAHIVWHQLTLALAAAECAAAGQPLLGDKWLPVLHARTANTAGTNLHAPSSAWGSGDHSWFTPVQRRLTEALLACWPLATGAPAPPPDGTTDAGWLPQRYTDGWFLRRGDERLRISESQLRGWYTHLRAAFEEVAPS